MGCAFQPATSARKDVASVNALLPSLEYTVDGNGRVDTAGLYRLISEAEWDAVQPRPRSRRTIYTQVLNEVRAGHLVAIPARGCKNSWTIARSLRIVADRLGVPVEIRRGRDTQNPDGDLVMVRAQRQSAGEHV